MNLEKLRAELDQKWAKMRQFIANLHYIKNYGLEKDGDISNLKIAEACAKLVLAELSFRRIEAMEMHDEDELDSDDYRTCC